MSYTAAFKDHLANPRNVGELENPTAIAEETNPVCGDRVRLSLSVADGRILAARFLAYGCPPTLVCSSVLTELLSGMPVTDAEKLTRAELIDKVGGLPARKHHAAALALETLHATLKQL